ncbi:bifunctional glycosyltransferase/CDP-glycerol:glycerophosphate glycerophosphotransferase [Streptomyces sp. VB1]|uniref:bifunctional glycosyltransferase/CDP-glycerol:glycerophosphate glycerophosphotransferase n=1 Tax=Streptomyces sp. VB1 TaxID=2986803 RepID=UPI0022419180|nr:CDP-glycerol glycerophosphotransferase family protein [Streptomyces sp. VB1]UZI30891.1 CDP-glycerol:glycerophosphate glycerophosphotransferase [Streptomyces sp. VB1]
MSDFSCVITGGGDGEGPGGAEALRASVESVLGQSLRGAEAVVVLASTAAPAVRSAARTLAERAPGRVRLLHADPAVRTTGALRNAGLDAAGGRYILVLATGERLQLHACRNLWQAGERSRADLIAGRWSRVADDSGKEREPSWQGELYARSRTLARFTEAPELVVRDALVTGFCLRREAARRHGLRYEEDLTHGEILFGPLAAAAVGRIALVRRLIVTGRAAPDRARDLAALVEAHRRVANTLLAHGLSELREEREKAFARDHLVPLARSFPHLPAARRDRVAAAAARALTGCFRDGLPDLPPLERVAVRLLARGDAEGVLTAAYALSRPATVCAPLTTGADGRVTWGGDPEGPGVDVTELGHQYRTFGGARLMNRLTRATADRGRLLLEGRLVLPGHGGPAPDAPLTATLEFRARGGARAVAFPVEEIRHDGNGISWRARADVSRRLRPVGARDTAWDARLTVTAGGPDGTRSVSDLFAPQDQVEGSLRFPARPRLGPLAGDTWEPYITLKDHFALRLTARRRPARTTHRLVRYATRFRPARKAKLLVRSLRGRLDRYRSRGFKVPVYTTWLTRLPVRRGSVVLESHMGTCYGDSPRALYEEIRRQGLKLHATWSYDPSPAGFPDGARLVRRWSWRYLWALARAEYWVDNQGFPQQLRKPRHTTYLQTWHGSAYKRMGFDERRVRLQNAPQRERLQRAVDRFDHFLVRSEHDVDTLARAYRLPEKRLLRTGYPRNDALIAERDRAETEGRLPRPPLAGALGLDDHKKTVLYAPTFRGGPGKQRRARLLLDVREFAERFGDTHTLLVRAHYLESARLPLCPPGTVVDVSRHHDVQELLALTDVLITDYSSIMFDFALLDRPVVLYAPDLEAYAAERGSYFDLREHAPGPVTATQEELFGALAELKKSETRYADRRRDFARRFGAYDRGDAARRTVAAVFAPGASRGARHTIDHDRGAGR